MQQGQVPAGRGGWVLVAGIGSRWRSDDAAGLLVAEQLRLLCPSNVEIRQLEALGPEMLDLWDSDITVILVDAVLSDAVVGTIRRLDLLQQPLSYSAAVSSHAIDVAVMVQLARVMDRLPRRLLFYGIQAGSVEPGTALSDAVACAISVCVDSIIQDIEASTIG